MSIAVQKNNLSIAKVKAIELLDRFNYHNPSIDPAIVSRKIGIKVLDCTFEDDNISGYYDFEEKAIFVNQHEFIKRQQFTIAHELGHAVLHEEWVKSSDYTCLYRDQLIKPANDPKEQEANEFAGNLLVPTFMLGSYYEELKNSQSFLHEDIIQKMSDIFFVSMPVIRIRLEKEYSYKEI